MAWTDFILPAVATVGGAYLAADANRDANKQTLQAQDDFNTKLLNRADRPRTDAFGNVIKPDSVELSDSGRQIVDALVGSGRASNEAFEAFNTSGFFGGQPDPNNPFNINRARTAIQDDNQKIRDAYIDPALEQFALRSARTHGASSNLGSGLQDEVSRLQSQYEIGDNQDILDYIIRNTLGIGNQQASTYAGGIGAVPQPGVDGAMAAILNSQARPGAVSPDLTGASIVTGLGNVFDAYRESEQQDRANKRYDELIRMLGDQVSVPKTRSQGSNFLDLSYFS